MIVKTNSLLTVAPGLPFSQGMGGMSPSSDLDEPVHIKTTIVRQLGDTRQGQGQVTNYGFTRYVYSERINHLG
jgi:hypothetical protein